VSVRVSRDALVAAGAAVVAFATSLGNGFAYDDVVVVRDNPIVASGGPREIFASPYWPREEAHRYRPEVTYRPLTVLSFAANRRLFGEGAFSFHLTNVLLHAATAALVVVLARRLGGDRLVALGAGLVFAVHPIHTEAVANVVGRGELLAALFWIAALVVQVARPPGTPLVIFLLALAAYLSKEVAVTLPAAILLIAWFRRTATSRESLTDVAAAVVAGLAFLGARSAVLGAAFEPGAAATYWDGGDAGVRVTTALAALAKYTQLFVLPATLSADYGFAQFPPAKSVADPRALAGVALLAACIAGAVALLRRRSLAGLGLALFAVVLVPVSNFLFPLNVILAERLLHLPSIGLGLAVAAVAVPRLSRRLAGRAAIGAVLLVLAARSALRNPVWADDATLFEHTVRDAPRSAKAWTGLGNVRAAQGRGEEARTCFEKALGISGDEYAAHDGLGHLALERGEWNEAMRHFQEAARVSPAEPAPLYNAGIVHLRGGNPRRAIDAFEAALAVDRGHALSIEGLAAAWQTLAVRQAAAGITAEAESSLVAGIARVRELDGDGAELERLLGEVRGAPPEVSRR
jgi:tetratricopeptide (TPR) repeat protein